MKSIVFDNAGTIIKRVTALKDMSNNNIIFETNTIGMANENDENLILVFQTPTNNLIQKKCKIVDFLRTHISSFEISYSTKNYTKEDVINALKNDETTIKDVEDSAKALVETYDIDICSGSAMIVNMGDNKIEYVYTAGGLFYDETKHLFKLLKNKHFPIYIASGDNKKSLLKIASILDIHESHVFDTCNSECKQKIVKLLQNKYDSVFMVGNNTNDLLAIKQANVGILTTQQGEELPEILFNSSDYVINNISEVLKIVEKEV